MGGNCGSTADLLPRTRKRIVKQGARNRHRRVEAGNGAYAAAPAQDAAIAKLPAAARRKLRKKHNTRPGRLSRPPPEREVSGC